MFLYPGVTSGGYSQPKTVPLIPSHLSHPRNIILGWYSYTEVNDSCCWGDGAGNDKTGEEKHECESLFRPQDNGDI